MLITGIAIDWVTQRSGSGTPRLNGRRRGRKGQDQSRASAYALLAYITRGIWTWTPRKAYGRPISGKILLAHGSGSSAIDPPKGTHLQSRVLVETNLFSCPNSYCSLDAHT